MKIHAGVKNNVRLTRVCRATGRVLGTDECHNAIVDIGKLVDLMDGAAADHLDAGADFRIKDSLGTTIKTIPAQQAGYPTTPAGGSVTLRWADETADTYNPDDVELLTNLGVKVAEVLNVAWPDKPVTENWYFEWDISISSGDTAFDTAGFNGLLECIVGASSQHWDGPGGANNMAIKVYDGTPGTLQFTQVATGHVQPSAGSIKWTFQRSTGTATWGRVEVHNNAQGNRLYDDDIANEVQNTGDIFTYEFTVTFS